jgi:hypothetical protein
VDDEGRNQEHFELAAAHLNLNRSVLAALRDAGFRVEWSVQCLDRSPCRAVYTDRAAAEERAAEDRMPVEVRLIAPWAVLERVLF